MRIWHWKLLPYLPKSQLLAQWRELNSIFKKQDKHILINYIYNYPKSNLYNYTLMVMVEMEKRDYQIKKLDNYWDFFEDTIGVAKIDNEVFKKHHTDQYLIQCFYNLQEKYDRGQKDFSKEQYENLEDFIKEELKI